jgi:hypothetical protein
MVYNLLGQLSRANVPAFEIVVVTPTADVIDTVRGTIEACLGTGAADGIEFMHMSLDEYLEVILEDSVLLGGGDTLLFDYIEYNGGLSKYASNASEVPTSCSSAENSSTGSETILCNKIDNDSFPTQLQGLHRLLQDETGVLGLTYFAHNVHVSRIRALVDSRNVNAMIPFSLHPSRLVRAYLEVHKMGILQKDTELLIHLGGSYAENEFVYRESQLVPRVQWRALTQQQALHAFTEGGFEITSRLPTGYSNAFGTFSFYYVGLLLCVSCIATCMARLITIF